MKTLKKCSSILMITCLFSIANFPLLSQNGTHNFEFALGSSLPRENGIYIDYGCSSEWVDMKMSQVVQLGYTYQYNPFVGLGCHIEYEKSQPDLFFGAYKKTDVSRFAFGVHYLIRFPERPFHAQLGGYINTGFLNSKDWDKSIKGIEYGLIAGPAYAFDKITMYLS